MTTLIRISDSIVKEAQVFGKIYNRSVPKQIEFWSKVGKIAEENPDMSYDQIRALLFSLEEQKNRDVESFSFSP
ncbi:MAG: ParD-like family protein [Alphaproteobacteria bacterium]|nr:ParD-like family protein [Alphaproteobacteria bacterium]